MQMIISAENLQNKIIIDEKISNLVQKAAEISLKNENFTLDCEISILFVNNEKIKEINYEHRNINKPTDVLSFPMLEIENGKIISDEGDMDIIEGVLLLGDIVISMEKTKEQAEIYGHSFEREFTFLLTHGIFHLLGYDHQDEDSERIMIQKQEEVLKKMGLEIYNEE